jgi:hypothetical protein
MSHITSSRHDEAQSIVHAEQLTLSSDAGAAKMLVPEGEHGTNQALKNRTSKIPQSSHVGVHWVKARNRWVARIKIQGKPHCE